MSTSIQIGDFFSLHNTVDSITDADYAKIGLIVEAAKAFERSTYQCVYIIDYFRRGFLYVSNNITKLCDGEAQKITDFGYRFYIEYVPEEDLKMLLNINNHGFNFFNIIPLSERKEYTISYNFHIKKGNKTRLVNHKLTPLVLTKDGKIWLAICTISLAASNTAGNIIMKRMGASNFYEYNLSVGQWEEKKEVALSDTERDILMLSTQGYTMSHIASIICRTVDAIKASKRMIFKKMKVKNIAEALAYAQLHQLI